MVREETFFCCVVLEGTRRLFFSSARNGKKKKKNSYFSVSFLPSSSSLCPENQKKNRKTNLELSVVLNCLH